ncbi:hypothetical protein P1A145kb_p160 [Pectobacterium phage DU_PP_I]|nr:hypothetical protein P1A145kb_p160 [Pectobacterium phage DU_PP_I]ATS93877.1 hypothetical protein P12B145kb_p161 [Pectobacterium phage DU_PP_IV]
MNYKHIMIDMDYCADPLWVSEDGCCFANGDLCEFEKVLPAGTMHSLAMYQDLWEKTHWTKYLGPSGEYRSYPGEDLAYGFIREMPPVIAAAVKESLPDHHIYYRCPETRAPVEVGTVSKNAIRATMVG